MPPHLSGAVKHVVNNASGGDVRMEALPNTFREHLQDQVDHCERSLHQLREHRDRFVAEGRGLDLINLAIMYEESTQAEWERLVRLFYDGNPS